MSQPNVSETDGPTADIAPKPEPQEGVKVVPSNNSSPQQYFTQPLNQQQYQQPQQYQQQQQQQQQQNFSGARPVLRRTDSRGSFRPPAPQYQNQIPFQQQPQQQNTAVRLPTQARPPPQAGNYYGGGRPGLINPGPRFPQPGVPQQQPIRYAPQYENQNQPDGQFRRAVNAVSYDQTRQQRPIQPGPRPQGIYQQKSLPGPVPISASPGSIQKSFTLDNSDVNVSHSAEEQNGSDANAKIFNNKNMDLISSEKPQKYEEVRSSSSLGFADPEKDIDTVALNGKSASREDIVERPDSRTGLSRDHSSNSSMLKITEDDDDDAVITPSRTAYVSEATRSGKSTPMSNSSDNISQKSVEITDLYKSKSPMPTDEIKKQAVYTNEPKTPELKQTPTPPMRNSTDNLSMKSLDVDTTRQITRTPSPLAAEQTVLNKSPVPELIPTNRIVTEVPKPSTLNIQEKISRSPSPAAAKPPPSPRNDIVKASTPDKDQRKFVQQKSRDMSPANSHSESPTLKETKGVKQSPRAESRGILSGRRTPSARSKGDNDSGVDESTQGNDRSFNGEQSSPRKTPSRVAGSKLPSGKCRTPVKMLQSPKSPDPSNSVPGSADKKKLPMNKVQVGSAPSPNIKLARSKVGSLDNTSYKPGGGKIKVENRKIDFSKVQPKIAAKNDVYKPGGGDKKSRVFSAVYRASSVEIRNYDDDEIQQQKLTWNAKSKIGSLENATYKPGGGDKKIETIKVDFKDKAKPKVGSKDNMKHAPGGGDIKSLEEVPQQNIENRKLEIQAQSKVGSLDNVKHKPGGGDIKIFDDKDYLKQLSSDQNALTGSQEDYDNNIVYVKKRSSNIKPPTSLNISSPSTKRRVRYLDLDGPRSLFDDSPQQPKSIDYQRPMSACSNSARKKSKSRVSFTIMDRPPWRY